MFGPGNAPVGCSSVQVEIYFSDKYKPINASTEEFIPIVKNELIQMGILLPNDQVLFEKSWISPYAQVIFDHERKEAVERIHNFLLENDIYFGGRYADWNYTWSDESFIRGSEGAEKIIDKL
jgi:protoporphyrinogen oxidase